MVRLIKIIFGTNKGLIGLTDSGRFKLKELPVEFGTIELLPGIMGELVRIAENDNLFYFLECCGKNKFVSYTIYEKR